MAGSASASDVPTSVDGPAAAVLGCVVARSRWTSPADSPRDGVSSPAHPCRSLSVLRKLAIAVLAVPVLAILYLPLLARRSVAARIGLLAGVGVIVIAAGVSLFRPVPITATAPAPTISALAADAFQSIAAATDLRAGVTVRFSEPMDRTSVGASLVVTPGNTYRVDWNAASTTATIVPTSHWAAGAYHTVTVEPGALAAGGRPLATAVRVAFVTRPPTAGRIEPVAGFASRQADDLLPDHVRPSGTHRVTRRRAADNAGIGRHDHGRLGATGRHPDRSPGVHVPAVGGAQGRSCL